MSHDDPITNVAEHELDHAHALLSEHQRDCQQPDCAECQSLKAHVTRCGDQLALLGLPADTQEMF